MFVCVRFEDKLPEWIDRFRAEGMTDQEIANVLQGKAEKYIDKWGNSSKVGVLINSYNNLAKQMSSLQSSPKREGVVTLQSCEATP